MKVSLFDFENQVPSGDLESAMSLYRESKEYTLQQPADDRYQVSSTQPSYQVDLHVLGEGQVRVKCYCTVFKRTRHCRHAVAALFILRDQLLRRRKSKSKSAPGEEPVEAALRKMSITELRKFVAQYASSHASFKSELLAHHLHRTRKPDYATLLMELTPIDKYGQIKLNRNNIKNVRSTLSILLRQAQQLAFQKALPETFQILEAMITQLYRLIQKFPAYQAQLSVELKPALRLFETISQQPMAPRLQQTVIRWVKDISGRDSYFLFPGIHPLLRMVESFVLETSMRNSFIQLAEEKITTDPSERALWAGLWLRWKRLWPSKTQNRPMNTMVRSLAGEVLPALYQQKDFEDYVFTLELYWAELAKTKSFKNYLQLGLKASVIIDDHTMQVKTAAALSQQHFDLEAWRSLAIIDEGLARKIIHQTGQDFEPGQLREVDLFLLEGFTFFQEGDALMHRLSKLEDLDLVMQYDGLLLNTHRKELEDLYASSVRQIRETYGGVVGRQKLNNIFSHLKKVDLFAAVTQKLKKQESTMPEMLTSQAIQGFVFDLDGVIVDTAVHHFQSWRKIMKELGIDIADEDDHHTRGASRMESLEYLLNKYGVKKTDQEKETIAARKNEYYLQAIDSITPHDLLPGALTFLEESRKAGLRLALGSASKNARGVLEKLGIEDKFDAILDGNDAKASKPDPEIFTKASQALHLDPEKVVVFEDAAKGIQAALAAGCHAVGLGDASTLGSADLVFPDLASVTPQQIIEALS